LDFERAKSDLPGDDEHAIPFPPLPQVESRGDLKALRKGAFLWQKRRPVHLSANNQPTN